MQKKCASVSILQRHPHTHTCTHSKNHIYMDNIYIYLIVRKWCRQKGSKLSTGPTHQRDWSHTCKHDPTFSHMIRYANSERCIMALSWCICMILHVYVPFFSWGIRSYLSITLSIMLSMGTVKQIHWISLDAGHSALRVQGVVCGSPNQGSGTHSCIEQFWSYSESETWRDHLHKNSDSPLWKSMKTCLSLSLSLWKHVRACVCLTCR